jgi:hypothetical protein
VAIVPTKRPPPRPIGGFRARDDQRLGCHRPPPTSDTARLRFLDKLEAVGIETEETPVGGGRRGF